MWCVTFRGQELLILLYDHVFAILELCKEGILLFVIRATLKKTIHTFFSALLTTFNTSSMKPAFSLS